MFSGALFEWGASPEGVFNMAKVASYQANEPGSIQPS